MSQTFIKNEEDFVCEHCGFAVAGNGYTNHCPHCLWSKHVDVNPGDRAAECGGMMRPDKLILEKGEFEIWHICDVCGHQKQNRTAKDDNLLGFHSLGGSTAK